MGGGVERRSFILFTAALATMKGVHSATNEIVYVDSAGVKDVRVLVEKMRIAAGNRLPSTLKVEEFYKAIVKAAFDNAHKASELNIQVPKFILDRLPKHRVNWMFVPVQSPIFVLIPLLGLTFAVPIVTLFAVVIGSAWVLMLLLEGEAKKRCPTCKKEEPPAAGQAPSTFLEESSTSYTHSI